MTEINKDDATKSSMEDARLKRRRILKSGALIAPLALTLHGGIPMAHANSTGCVDELEAHVEIPKFDLVEQNGMMVFEWNGSKEPFDSEFGVTGRTLPLNELNPNNPPESHWDYLITEELYGASCMTSIISTGMTVNFSS